MSEFVGVMAVQVAPETALNCAAMDGSLSLRTSVSARVWNHVSSGSAAQVMRIQECTYHVSKGEDGLRVADGLLDVGREANRRLPRRDVSLLPAEVVQLAGQEHADLQLDRVDKLHVVSILTPAVYPSRPLTSWWQARMASWSSGWRNPVVWRSRASKARMALVST